MWDLVVSPLGDSLSRASTTRERLLSLSQKRNYSPAYLAYFVFVPASDLTVDSLYVEARCTVVDAFLGITYKRSMKGKKAAYKWLYIQHGRTHSVKLGIISPFQTLRQEEHVFISQLNPTLSTITWTVWATCPHLISSHIYEKLTLELQLFISKCFWFLSHQQLILITSLQEWIPLWQIK